MAGHLSSAASGPAAGFLYQFERALAWLSRSGPTGRVGIETTDDVVYEGEDRSVQEQDKHGLDAGGTAFGDTSVDLWKTLANWCRAIDSGTVSGNFELHLVTNKTVLDGLAVRMAR